MYCDQWVSSIVADCDVMWVHENFNVGGSSVEVHCSEGS